MTRRAPGVTELAEVAIAHDYLTQRGGAERVVLALQHAFPQAPIYTTAYDAARSFTELADSEIVTSPLQRIGPLRRNPRLALPLLVPIVKRMDVPAKVTVCSTSGWAHGMTTRGTKVVYVHNTARWLYQRREYLAELPASHAWGIKPLAPALRRWDRRAADSADIVLANSAVTRARVRTHWGRDAEILHPPPGLAQTGPHEPLDGLEPGFLLTVTRLLPYKRVDAVLGALHGGVGGRLVVVGDGPDRARLAALAPPGTMFLANLSDAQLRWLYANAEALVTAAHDDFGLTPLEAMQFGTPVVAVREGGFPETVVQGETGVLFDGADPAGVRAGIEALRDQTWDRARIEARAADFSLDAFTCRIREIVALAAGQVPELDPRVGQ